MIVCITFVYYVGSNGAITPSAPKLNMVKATMPWKTLFSRSVLMAGAAHGAMRAVAAAGRFALFPVLDHDGYDARHHGDKRYAYCDGSDIF